MGRNKRSNTRDELDKLFRNPFISKKFFISGTGRTTEESNKLLEIMENIIYKYHNFEKPDAYVIVDNQLFGIEHFEVSPFDEGIGGDVMKKTETYISDKLNDCTEPGLTSLSVQCKNATIDDFIHAFERIYSKHLKNLDSYKYNLLEIRDNLIEDGFELMEEIPIIFLVECSAVVIRYLDETGKITCFNPFFIENIYQHIMSQETKPEFMCFCFPGGIGIECECHINLTEDLPHPHFSKTDERLIFVPMRNISRSKIIIVNDENST